MKERIDNERKEIQISVDKVIVRRVFYVDESKDIVCTIQSDSITPFQTIIGSGKYDEETSRRT